MKNQSRRTGILITDSALPIYPRVVAKFIDTIVLMTAFFIGAAIWGPIGIMVAVIIGSFQDAMGTGQSVGKRIMGLRVTEDYSGLPCSMKSSFVRNFPMVLLTLFGGVPFVWGLCLVVVTPIFLIELYLLFTLESGVRIGDVLANTLVVEYVEPTVSNYR